MNRHALGAILRLPDSSPTIRTMGPTVLQRLGALVAIVLLLLCVAPQAIAQPNAANAETDGDTARVPLNELGSSSTIQFWVRRDTTNAYLNMPIPPGLNPIALNTTLELPVNLRYASLAVYQNGRTLSRQLLPPEDKPEMVIPLNGAEIYGNYLSLTLTMTAVPIENYCWDPLNPIRLTNTTITFDGRALTPKTVATYLPPVLKKLTIAIPEEPTAAESTAAVQLASNMTSQYAGQNPDIRLVPLRGGATTLPPPGNPMERQIIVKEGPDEGLSLQGGGAIPNLLISGPEDELIHQSRLLFDESLRYAVSRKAVAGAIDTEEKLAKDFTTVEDLNKGPTNITAEGLWPSVTIPIDQPRFGHSLGGIKVHIKGSHTPNPQRLRR